MPAWLLEGGEAGDERTARSGHAEKWSSGFTLPMSLHRVREASSEEARSAAEERGRERALPLWPGCKMAPSGMGRWHWESGWLGHVPS